MKEELQPANVIVRPRPKIPEPIALSHSLITVSDRTSSFHSSVSATPNPPTQQRPLDHDLVDTGSSKGTH
jgi:hypothetical protein